MSKTSEKFFRYVISLVKGNPNQLQPGNIFLRETPDPKNITPIRKLGSLTYFKLTGDKALFIIFDKIFIVRVEGIYGT